MNCFQIFIVEPTVDHVFNISLYIKSSALRNFHTCHLVGVNYCVNYITSNHRKTGVNFVALVTRF